MTDARRWWFCGAAVWPAMSPYEAPNGRSALAAYRADLVAAEMVNGRSRRWAVDIVRAAGLEVVRGPLSTEDAYALDLGWQLAWAISDAHSGRGVPVSPASASDAARWLPARLVKVITAGVGRTFALDQIPTLRP